MLRKFFPAFSVAFALAFALLCALGISCKKDNPIQPPPPPGHTAITFQATFTSTRWCRLQWSDDSTAASHHYILIRNQRDTIANTESFGNFGTRALQDTALTPESNYSYWLYRIVNGQHWDSATVNVRTLDTTKDNYTWETIRVGGPGSLLHGIWASSPHSVWACGGSSLIHVVNDSVTYYNPEGNIYGCYGLTDSLIWLANENTLTDWDGHKFTHHAFNGDSLPMLAPINFGSVWVTPDGREVFAVGGHGVIVHRRPDWKWEVQPSGTSLALGSLVAFSNHDVYAVGATASESEGIILHYDGTAWREIAHGYSPPPSDTTLLAGYLIDIGGQSPDSLYAVGRYIYKRTATGWKLVADAPCNNPKGPGCGAVKFAVSGTWNNMWIVGDGGYILHFNGDHWTTIPNFFDANAGRVLVGAQVFTNDVFLVGTDNQGGLILHGR